MGVANALSQKTEANGTANKPALPTRNGTASNGMSASVSAAPSTSALLGSSRPPARPLGQSTGFSSKGKTITPAPAVATTTARRDVTETQNRAAKPGVTLPGVVRGVTPATVPGTNVAANTGTSSMVAATYATNDLTSTATTTTTNGITGEQNRRARRAQRAALIFQEQCQIRQAEDAAHEEQRASCSVTRVETSTVTSSSTTSLFAGGKNSGVVPLAKMTNGVVVGPSSSTATSTVCSSSKSSAKFTEVVNSIQAGPTIKNAGTQTPPTLPPPAHATTNSMQGPTFINKASKNHIANNPSTTIQPALPLLPAANRKIDTCCKSSSPSVSICASTVAVTMASAKVSNSPVGSDVEDGNESDDSGFVMTRTAGKRRLNVSAADMIANEILDDVNEELVVEDEEVTDPIKRLHRGYMNEAVAMVRVFFFFFFCCLLIFFTSIFRPHFPLSLPPSPSRSPVAQNH